MNFLIRVLCFWIILGQSTLSCASNATLNDLIDYLKRNQNYAIFTAVGITGLLTTFYFLYKKKYSQKAKQKISIEEVAPVVVNLRDQQHNLDPLPVNTDMENQDNNEINGSDIEDIKIIEQNIQNKKDNLDDSIDIKDILEKIDVEGPCFLARIDEIFTEVEEQIKQYTNLESPSDSDIKEFDVALQKIMLPNYDQETLKKIVFLRVLMHNKCLLSEIGIKDRKTHGIYSFAWIKKVQSSIPYLLNFMFQPAGIDDLSFSIAWELLETAVEEAYFRLQSDKTYLANYFAECLISAGVIAKRDTIDLNKVFLLFRLFFCEENESNPGSMQKINYNQKDALWFTLSKRLLKEFVGCTVYGDNEEKLVRFLLNYCYPFSSSPLAWKESEIDLHWNAILEELKVANDDALISLINEARDISKDTCNKQLHLEKQNELTYSWILCGCFGHLLRNGNKLSDGNSIANLHYVTYMDMPVYFSGKLWDAIDTYTDVLTFEILDELYSQIIPSWFSTQQRARTLEHWLFCSIRDTAAEAFANSKSKGQLENIATAIKYFLSKDAICLHTTLFGLDLRKIVDNEKYPTETRKWCESVSEGIKEVLHARIMNRDSGAIVSDMIGSYQKIYCIDYTLNMVSANLLYLCKDVLPCVLNLCRELKQYYKDDEHIIPLLDDILLTEYDDEISDKIKGWNEGSKSNIDSVPLETLKRYMIFGTPSLIRSLNNEKLILGVLNSDSRTLREKNIFINYCAFNEVLVDKIMSEQFCKECSESPKVDDAICANLYWIGVLRRMQQKDGITKEERKNNSQQLRNTLPSNFIRKYDDMVDRSEDKDRQFGCNLPHEISNAEYLLQGAIFLKCEGIKLRHISWWPSKE